MSEENKPIEQKKLTPEEIKKAKDEADLKYMIEGVKKMKEYEFSLLPKTTRDLITHFVNTSIENKLTDEEILDCIKFMPAEFAEQICDRFKYNEENKVEKPKSNSKVEVKEQEYDKLTTKLCKLYADEFVKACENAKDGKLKISTPPAYKQFYKRNKTKRFLSYYELFMILNGLGLSVAPLMMSKAEQPDNKYYKIVKALHTERFDSKYRNSEYKVLCDMHENFVKDAIDIQAEIISKHNEPTV